MIDKCPLDKKSDLAFAYYIFPNSNGNKFRIKDIFYCPKCNKFFKKIKVHTIFEEYKT